MRKAHALAQVAVALLDEPSGRHWGYELFKRSGVRSGVLYPMLSRMLDEGWLTDGWEDPNTIRGKRPPRRYYELTDKGRRESGGLLRAARSDARFTSLAWNRACCCSPTCASPHPGAGLRRRLSPAAVVCVRLSRISGRVRSSSA